MYKIHFWNGNKSPSRREFEAALLDLCLKEGGAPAYCIEIDDSDYPQACDESAVFSRGCDVLISVAGNQKFSAAPCIMHPNALCRGLLGHRLLITRTQDASQFASITNAEQLKRLTVGIPATWADAELFRQNDYRVCEKGGLDDVFTRLLNHEFDYIALGANEIESIFCQHLDGHEHLQIEPHLLLYYPLPLVFYFHSDNTQLARWVATGLKRLIDNGQHMELFMQFHPDLVRRLGLKSRRKITLHNPNLPKSMSTFSADL